MGFLGILGFFVQRYKGGRIANTPFHKTGDVASRGSEVAGDKGALSTEGKVVVNDADLLVSPVQGKKALFYKLTVSATWKAGENDKTVEVLSEKKGVVFGLDDGSGVCKIDPTGGGDFEPVSKFDKSQTRGLISTIKGGGLEFGDNGFTVHPGDRVNNQIVPENAKYSVKEEVLEPGATFYVCGKYEGGVIKAPSWVSLMISTQSRDAALASTMKTANTAKMVGIGGFGSGVVMLAIGLIFGGGGDNKAADKAPADTKPAMESPAEKPAAPAEKPAAPAEKPAEAPAAAPAAPAAAPAAPAGGGKAGGKAGGGGGGAGGKAKGKKGG